MVSPRPRLGAPALAALVVLPTITPVALAAKCKSTEGIDVCMALDESASISPSGFTKEKAFALQIYDSFLESDTKIGVTTFSSYSTEVVSLGTKFDDARDLLDEHIQSGGGTNIQEALEGCENQLFNDGNAKNERKRLIILMTDGQNDFGINAGTLSVAESLRKRDVVLATVGISETTTGTGFDEDFLRNISSKKTDGGDLFYTVSVSQLPDDADTAEIVKEVCESGVGNTDGGLSTIGKVGIGICGVAVIAAIAIACWYFEVFSACFKQAKLALLPCFGGATGEPASGIGSGADVGTGMGGGVAAGVGPGMTMTSDSLPIRYDPGVQFRPDSHVFPYRPLPKPGAEPNSKTDTGEPEDIDDASLPDAKQIHISIALDTSFLGCSAKSIGGDNRKDYVSLVRNLLMALSVPAIGKVETSLVKYSGDTTAYVALNEQGYISENMEDITEAISNIGAPDGADQSRATPHGTINAIESCIHLLRESKGQLVKRRVLVLSGGGYSETEFKSVASSATGDGGGWRSASCVVGAFIGDKVDAGAAVKVASSAVFCHNVGTMGTSEMVKLLRNILTAENPRRESERLAPSGARADV